MYATEQNLDAAWGASFLDVLTIDERTTLRDGAKITSALENASALIDSYVGRRFPLPLVLAPAGQLLLRGMCCDLAIGALATSADRMTDIIQKRYDQALSFLRDVASGKADVPMAASMGGESAGVITPNEAVIEAAPRVFTRDSMKGF